MAAKLIFTDLDGTLLDHDTYSWEPAKPALDELRDKGIPLVLASSKTAAEIVTLRDRLGFSHCPAIVENGAGLLPPNASGLGEHTDHDRIRAALDAMPQDLRKGFVGFTDMGIDGVIECTGLSRLDAEKASQRQFSEPGLWVGTPREEARFVAALFDLGIAARKGGRFLTLSFGATKGDRMAQIAADTPDATIMALGDAPNDVEMLEKADVGIVVANPHGNPLPPLQGEAEGRIHRTTLPGPAGWNAAVLEFLDTE